MTLIENKYCVSNLNYQSEEIGFYLFINYIKTFLQKKFNCILKKKGSKKNVSINFKLKSVSGLVSYLYHCVYKN